MCTTIGSAFVFCTSYANTKVLAGALGVSAGVMIYVSFVEIFATKAIEGFETSYPNDADKLATLCFFCGAGLTYLLDGLVHKIGMWQKNRSVLKKAPAVCVCHSDPADMLAGERALFTDAVSAVEDADDERGGARGGEVTAGEVKLDVREDAEKSTDSARDSPVKVPATIGGMSSKQRPDSERELLEMSLESAIIADIDTPEKEHLKNMGFMTALAIGLHNFPEGLATFVAALADTKLGIALALAIAIHNIPEGVCVAMPVYYATGSKLRGFWWSFVSGLSEPFGGLCGFLVLYSAGMSDSAYGALFGIVGGMMVYISLKELLPTALKYDPHDKYVTNCTFIGMAVMAASLIMFTL